MLLKVFQSGVSIQRHADCCAWLVYARDCAGHVNGMLHGASHLSGLQSDLGEPALHWAEQHPLCTPTPPVLLGLQ